MALVLDGKVIPDRGATTGQGAAWAEKRIRSLIQRHWEHKRASAAADALRTHVSAPTRVVLGESCAPSRLEQSSTDTKDASDVV